MLAAIIVSAMNMRDDPMQSKVAGIAIKNSFISVFNPLPLAFMISGLLSAPPYLLLALHSTILYIPNHQNSPMNIQNI